MATINNDTRKTTKQANKIIKGIDDLGDKTKESSNKIQDKAVDKTIAVNGKETPFKASSLVAADIDSNLQKVINDVDSNFAVFVEATEKYLATNFAIKLTKRDLEAISKKESEIIEALVSNTDILKQDIQNILTQNLGKGISEKQLVLELKELYPAYARNASTIVNTGLGRLFIDTNISKFRDSNFNWYIWAGPDDSITREIPCKHWVWHRFPASQLSTITATRMRLWNCRHSIIPIADSQISKYPVGDLSFA